MSALDTTAAPPPPPRRWPRLGELLVERGLVTHADVEAALARQRERGIRLGECLLELGLVERAALYQVLADGAGVPYVDLQNYAVDVVLTALVPEAVARRFQALPVEQRAGEIVVAMDSPDDLNELDDLRVITGATVVPALADPVQLEAAINRAYSVTDVRSTISDAVDDFGIADHVDSIDELAEGPIVRLVDALLERAVNERASDLHIDPLSDRVRLRERVDGVLREVSTAPISLLRPLVSRIKIMAGLDISLTRVPQDGRFSVAVHGHEIDVRVATLPSSHGESIVLRLLDSSRGMIGLPGLGFRPEELRRYTAAFRAPQGAVIVSGPTGSGKTSTLYATLAEINTPARSIVSIEDPVEYQLDGLKQIQIHPKAGLTFPTALRSILRNDPNVIFVGEIRDGETARIASEASITGHLVLSTIHTTSAAAVPMRLADMGVEPYLVASALTCVVAQRLARRLCAHCAVEHDDLGEAFLRRLGFTEEMWAARNIRKAVGCEACHGSGYHGRFAIYEVLVVTDEIRSLIAREATTAEIQRVAVADGMDTMRTAALRRVVDGVLTVDELTRVVS